MDAPPSHSTSASSEPPLITRAPSTSSTIAYPPTTPHLSSLLSIRSTPGAGRGVYARKPLSVGTLLEISPVLLFPAQEYAQHGRHTQLDSYTFVWRRESEGTVMALALGIGSLFNHHPTTPNVSYSLDHAAHCIRYTLVRAAAEGEELCISYGAGRMWWETEGEATAPSEVDEDELLRLGSDMEEEEREKESAQVASTSTSSVSALDTRSNSNNAPPRPRLWRITAAIDPATAPLTLMQVWALRVEPRCTDLFTAFRKAFHSHPTFQAHLAAAPEVDMTHLRTFRRLGTRETGQELHALVCAWEELPSREVLGELLLELEARKFTPGEEEAVPMLLEVPSYAAPSRARLPEWTQQWPCASRANLLGGSVTPGASGSTSPVPGGLVAGCVDRQADEAYWNDEYAEWARRKMCHTVELARAAKRRGELPIAAHVTVPVQPVPERGIANGGAGGARVGRSSAAGSNYSSRNPSRVATPSPCSDPAAQVQSQQGHGPIEADAHDTRLSARNPIQHAVTNAIKAVAAIRAERDRERATLGLSSRHGPTSLRSSSPTISSDLETSTSQPAAARPQPTANGQDYLLNSLVLFTTHEPCVACCMSLVHSRVKAIFFLLPSPGAGGCCGARLAKAPIGGEDGGPYAVQEQNGLNHKFDVWRYQGALFADEEMERQAREELHVGQLDP